MEGFISRVWIWEGVIGVCPHIHEGSRRQTGDHMIEVQRQRSKAIQMRRQSREVVARRPIARPGPIHAT